MADIRNFQSNVEAFEYACEHVECSLKDGHAVLAIVLGTQGRMCAVKVANREDKSVPSGTLNELLAQNLAHVCFSAMLADKVPNLETGDLVLYTTMPELAAAGKTTVAGTVVAKVEPHYSSKTGWQVRKHQDPQSTQPAGSPKPE